MSENLLDVKPVSDLLNMKFFIPSYQRGYRWTERQVLDLLNDIDEFTPENSISGVEKMYCLQPLVVRLMGETDKRLADELDKSNWYEVIDGQQRLTTIFLIVQYFNEMWVGKQKKSLPTIKYETRSDSYSFLRSLEINESQEAVTPSGLVFKDYIDYHFMKQAYSTIHHWALWKGVLFNNNFYQSKLIFNTKFIWYQSVDEDPVKVFTRLNIGKISLTNAELIKALFLNRSNFKGNDDFGIRLRQQEIASEWDQIEYVLQNNEFWLFLHEKGYDRPTRIDFIFDLICDDNSLGLKNEQIDAIGADEFRTFRYFYEYFKSDKSKIDECWQVVKNYFQTFAEWFDDLEFYHYIGFLVEYKFSLSKLKKLWDNEQTDKKIFISKLKEEIKSILQHCPSLDYQYKMDGSDKGKSKPILLFHNIQTVINQNYNQLKNDKYESGVFYRFPFHLYKNEGWDVEHINSNTTNPEDDLETQKEWLLNVYLSATDDVREEIKTFFITDDSSERTAKFEKIKSEIPQHDNWSQEEKNRLWNFALLDSSTNRSYGNSIFSGKRRIIIGKDKGKQIAVPKLTRDGRLEFTKEVDAASSFVPPCTKQVFMKFYSVASSDNNYWTKEVDAPAYLQDIKDCMLKLEE